jgi:enoyl-CoA hydratase
LLEAITVEGVVLAGMNHPPVNSIGAQLRRELFDFFTAVSTDSAVQAVVLHGIGRGFSAGGELRETGTPQADEFPGLSADVHPAIERCPVPVIAAVHGFAIGGGLETALACHYRVVSASARIRLPEVTVGLLPLSGTQRLPRLLDASRCLQLVVGAHECVATAFRGDHMFDEIVDSTDSEIVPAALALARRVIDHRPLPLVRHRPLLDRNWQRAFTATSLPTEAAALNAYLSVRSAYECDDFEAGMAAARLRYERLTAAHRTRQ